MTIKALSAMIVDMFDGNKSIKRNGEDLPKVFEFPDIENSIELGIQWHNHALLKQLIEKIGNLGNEIETLKAYREPVAVGKKSVDVLTEVDLDDMITRSDLANRWKVSIQTLKRREKEGILKPLILGGCVRYEMVDILKTEKESKVAYA